MYDNNLFIKDGIIYYTTDGFSKQYRCSNAMWLLYALEFSYKVIIYTCNNAPGRGRSKIHDINLHSNTYLKQKFA